MVDIKINQIDRDYADKCEFYPVHPDDPACACNSDISGPFVCTFKYSRTCGWAIERRGKEKA